MCVEQVTEIEVLEEDMTAYKITNYSGFSRYSPGLRDLQTGFDHPGANIFYTIGGAYVSRFESSPGLYCFESKDAAIADSCFDERIIEVVIPKGSKIKRATDGFYMIILAERLTVTSLVRDSLVGTTTTVVDEEDFSYD